MTFSEKLKQLMAETKLTQADVRRMTGIGASSLSQYLSGKNEPYPARKREIAVALGMKENFFEDAAPEVKIAKNPGASVKVEVIARLMHKSKEWVMQGLRDQVFPWGYAVKMTNWSYFISPVRFTQETGIAIPPEYLEG